MNDSELRELRAGISKARAPYRAGPKETSLQVIGERLRQRMSVSEGLRNLFDYLIDVEMGEVSAPAQDMSTLRELGLECERLCHDQSLPEIDQARAVMCLAGIHANKQEPRLAKWFAQLVMDDCRAVEVRRQAYVGLFELAGRSALDWPDSDFNFPADVDWPFVQRFA